MKHIHLDAEGEAVKQFFRSLPLDARCPVLELEGRALALVLRVTAGSNSDEEGPWTEEKNARRRALIDREIDGSLTPQEAVELYRLQRAMLRHRRRSAPLPLEDARKLHQQLLKRAETASNGG